MADFYWELVQHDGTRIEIPPSAVETVKKRWNNNQPIHTSSMSIPANQIKTFRPTDKVYGQQPLLEAAAHAFNDPIYTNDGSIAARWVKRQVPQQLYSRYYLALPSYHRLGDDNGGVIMAFKLPVHQIDTSVLSYCTEEEIRELERD